MEKFGKKKLIQIYLFYFVCELPWQQCDKKTPTKTS